MRARVLSAFFVVPIALTAAVVAGQTGRIEAVDNQFVNPMGDLLPLLQHPRIEKELEILADQKQALRKVNADALAAMRDLRPFSNDENRDEARRRYNEEARKISADVESKLEEILLPEQVRRIRQIAVQMKLSSTGYGSSAGLTSREMAEALGITELQKEKLREKEKEVTREVREKTQAFYRELQQESRKKLLEVLTLEQRQRLEELTGKQFDWHQPAEESREKK